MGVQQRKQQRDDNFIVVCTKKIKGKFCQIVYRGREKGSGALSHFGSIIQN